MTLVIRNLALLLVFSPRRLFTAVTAVTSRGNVSTANDPGRMTHRCGRRRSRLEAADA